MKALSIFILLLFGVLLATCEKSSTDANETVEIIEAVRDPKPVDNKKGCTYDGMVVLDYGTFVGILMGSFLLGMLASYGAAFPFFNFIVLRTVHARVLRSLLTRLNRQRNLRLAAELRLREAETQIRDTVRREIDHPRRALNQILAMFPLVPACTRFNMFVMISSFFVFSVGTVAVACNIFNAENINRSDSQALEPRSMQFTQEEVRCLGGPSVPA
ncbi:hypothetical protein CAEBREN_24067 [Caenorhabditis brenneri]|uniref:Uncharacterized protein n=1 Tax=Caenorhabditis brenneri TaxID=135651 RepID=G0NL95_CAEBE|nr:hypothetical protein CAEBREN_24067 [Caenorhabditis brenneri]